MGRWGNCDFSELRDLQRRIEQAQREQMDAFCRAAAKELAARLLAKVIRRTPTSGNTTEDIVDEVGKPVKYKRGKKAGQTKQRVIKNGGTLRRGWTVRTESEAMSGSGKGGYNKDKVTAFTDSLNITKIGNTYQITVMNPVHYASYVEFGHRQQPGRYVPAIGKRLKKAWAPGRFMLTLSENELRREAAGILKRKLEVFFSGVVNGG